MNYNYNERLTLSDKPITGAESKETKKQVEI